ncbi:MAG: ABC transporter substrate-binding protein [Clostridia bacterium]|jgi:peptide/nickel transport system substrate-binding protein
MKKLMWVITALLLLSTAILSGCGGGQPATEPTEAPTETQAPAESEAPTEEAPTETEAPQITEYKQSPMLDDMDLPPVKERLPEEPKLTNEMPADALDYEIGTYGGTLRTVTSRIEWDADVYVCNVEPLLNTPGILGEEVTGNVLKGYEVSADQKEFTMYMRKGLKWSDGEPVTMEDFRFAIEDFLFNEELNPVFPVWLRSAGKPDGTPVKFEPIDDWTFKLIFDQPYGGFLIRISIEGWRGYHDLLKPAHYLKQFHKKYTDEADLEAKIEEAGYQPGEWWNLFNDKDITAGEMCQKKAIGFPRLYPWLLVKADDQKSVYERNPYYFKIDAEGNQLPYIDKLESSLVQDMEMVSVKTIAGEVDLSRESAALVKMPLYRENAEKAGYTALLRDMHVSPTGVMLNLTNKDPNWQKVVHDVRFRKALNLAIDRDELIDALYYGFAEPSTQIDSTYDPEEANRLLDEMGMTKGSDGYRLGPDGKTFEIPFEVSELAPDMVPFTELIIEMWKEIGIKASMKTIDSGLRGTRITANEIYATVAWKHIPLWYVSSWDNNVAMPLWHSWWSSGGAQGEEPPAEIKELYNIIDEIAAAPPVEGKQLFETKHKPHMKEHVWYIFPLQNVQQPLIVNSKLGNVPTKGFAIATNFSFEQMFFRE